MKHLRKKKGINSRQCHSQHSDKNHVPPQKYRLFYIKYKHIFSSNISIRKKISVLNFLERSGKKFPDAHIKGFKCIATIYQ